MSNSFLSAYFKTAELISKSRFLDLIGIEESRTHAFKNEEWLTLPSYQNQSIHFHASSVGELEIITPIIEEFAQRRMPLVLTVFSSSASKTLSKLSQNLIQSGAEVLFSGYSPREDHWEMFLRKFNVIKSIGTKYEAWPGLWVALSKMNLPLIMIHSRNSSSLRIAKRMLNLFGVSIPKIYFFGAEDISADFPGSEFINSIDPRCIRIARRASRPNARVETIKEAFSNSLRPFGVLGSAWIEDLNKLLPALLGYSGTIFVVPHKVDPETIQIFEERILQEVTKDHYARTSLIRSDLDSKLGGFSKRFILVDEIGILLELYSLADWAYVGGGFTRGVHSTMEPAFYGIPVACGPKNASKFLEITKLIQVGQLSLCSDTDEFRDFVLSKGNQPKIESNIIKNSSKEESLLELVEEISRIR